MTIERSLAAALALAAVLPLAACGTAPSTGRPAGASSSASDCSNCGIIEGIAMGDTAAAGRPGVGAVVGGVAGAAVGSQIGSGKGQTAATIAGAAGGAYAGHKIQQARQEKQTYRYTLRMQDGSHKLVTQDTNPGFRVGDPVRVVNGEVVPR